MVKRGSRQTSDILIYRLRLSELCENWTVRSHHILTGQNTELLDNKWLTGIHGNLESTEKSESAENLESTEKMTLRLVSFHKISSLETKSDLN